MKASAKHAKRTFWGSCGILLIAPLYYLCLKNGEHCNGAGEKGLNAPHAAPDFKTKRSRVEAAPAKEHSGSRQSQPPNSAKGREARQLASSMNEIAIRAFRNLPDSGEGFERAESLTVERLLEGLTKDNHEVYVDAFFAMEELPDCEFMKHSSGAFSKALLMKIAAVSPAAAVAIYEGRFSQYPEAGPLNGLLETWAGTDPSQAYVWLDAQSIDENRRSEALVSLLAGAVQISPNWVMDMLAKNKDAPSEQWLPVYVQLSAKGALDFEALKLASPETDFAWTVIREAADQIGRKSPREAIEFIDLNGGNGGELKDSQDHYFRLWVRKDPETALQWMTERSDGHSLGKNWPRYLVMSWPHESHSKLVDWLENADDSPVRDQVLSQYRSFYPE